MTNHSFWAWVADNAWELLLLGAVILEALLVWAYRGDRDPEPWTPTHRTIELTAVCTLVEHPRERTLLAVSLQGSS